MMTASDVQIIVLSDSHLSWHFVYYIPQDVLDLNSVSLQVYSEIIPKREREREKLILWIFKDFT